MTQEFVTLPREFVEQALEALKYEKGANNPLDWHHDKTMNALRAALEQHVEQKPVAWMYGVDGEDEPRLHFYEPLAANNVSGVTPLYTHQQPKREPLMEAEIGQAVRWLYQDHLAAEMGLEGDVAVARAIEAAHNIK